MSLHFSTGLPPRSSWRNSATYDFTSYTQHDEPLERAMRPSLHPDIIRVAGQRRSEE